MKVLSLLEPWASLIKQNVKQVETRSWKTNYRGELYIHASKGKIDEKNLKIQELMELLKYKELCYGKIIVKCKLVDCIYMDEEYVKKSNFTLMCDCLAGGKFSIYKRQIKLILGNLKTRKKS